MQVLAKYFHAFLFGLFITLTAAAAHADGAGPGAGHLSANSGMQVPDSLSAPASSPNAAATDQDDQDKGGEVKPLPPAKPNITIEGEENDPEQNITDLMNLIASMPQGIQDDLMKEAALAKQYCQGNMLLPNFYDCSCFSLKMVAARIRKGPDIAYINLIQDGQYKECLSPGLIAGYGLNRCTKTLNYMNIPTGQMTDICECVGRSLARNFIAQPTPNAVYINHLFSDVLSACRTLNGF